MACFLICMPVTTVFSAENGQCPAAPGEPWNPIFRGLKGINLITMVNDRSDIKIKSDFWKESLFSNAAEQITKHVMPFVQRDEKCQLPDIKVLDIASLDAAIIVPDRLTYVIAVNFFPLSEGPVAAITVHVYRAGLRESDYVTYALQPGVTVISLDDFEFTIKRKLKTFFGNTHLMLVFFGDRD